MPRTSNRSATAPSFVEQGATFMQLEGRHIRPAPEAGETRVDVVVIGAGQAGLSAGFHLSRQGADFIILEAAGRIGEQWRNRWDSLRLFTPAKFDGLDGMAFPAEPNSFPTKDEMADYLEAYAKRFKLPVRLNAPVETLESDGEHYLVTAAGRRYRARAVIVAAASYQKPRLPEFAAQIDPSIQQIHSFEYRNPAQLQDGPVLIVGAGNSGAEIARDLSGDREIWLAGRNVGEIPFEIAGFAGRYLLARLVVRVLFHRVLTSSTPMGRSFRPKFLSQGGPLIRVKSRHLKRLGVERTGRVAGVKDGKPILDDGRVLDVANVVWCTGFKAGLDWIRLPIFDETGRPRQERGIVADAPGLYFVGLHFLHSPSSTMVHGVGRDAKYVVDAAARRLAGAELEAELRRIAA